MGFFFFFMGEALNNSGNKEDSKMEVTKLSGMEANDGWDAATSR